MSRGRALLLGWGNATRSQLAVYERLHTALDLEPTSVIPDTLAGLRRPEAYPRALAPIAADLAREGGDRPIVVHLFSDNGFVGWAALLAALAETDPGRRARDAIRAVILDSSPGLWAVRGKMDFARRFALGMTPAVSRLAGRGALERMPIVTPLLGVGFVAYQLVFRRSVRAMLSAPAIVEQHQPRCPHLFLYGEEDVLVPPRDVRAWIARQRAGGLDVSDEPFANARHVALYPNDPRRYRRAVNAFILRALDG
ncbi:MAG: DUF829 domain-containing protein [Labilithrix sp.]|nr:DUF829 domain-containing protein [Labilithrix sp.]